MQALQNFFSMPVLVGISLIIMYIKIDNQRQMLQSVILNLENVYLNSIYFHSGILIWLSKLFSIFKERFFKSHYP